MHLNKWETKQQQQPPSQKKKIERCKFPLQEEICIHCGNTKQENMRRKVHSLFASSILRGTFNNYDIYYCDDSKRQFTIQICFKAYWTLSLETSYFRLAKVHRPTSSFKCYSLTVNFVCFWFCCCPVFFLWNETNELDLKLKLDRADSVTWNPHKMMGITLQCAAVLFKEDVSFSVILWITSSSRV